MMPNNVTNSSLPPNYILTKENSEIDINQVKSPEVTTAAASTSVSISATTPSLFPFRSGFMAPSASFDRFSNEMLAARNQFLFDTYHNVVSNGSLGHSKSLFHPNLFFEKQRLENTTNNNNNNDLNDSQKSIDVIGDEVENTVPTLSSFKAMYNPFTFSKHYLIDKAMNDINGMSKLSNRKSIKSGEGKIIKKMTTGKTRIMKKKAMNDELLVLEENCESIRELNSHRHVRISNEEMAQEVEHNKQTEKAVVEQPKTLRIAMCELDQCGNRSSGKDETSCDVEVRSELGCSTPVTEDGQSKRCSPVEYVSSQSPKQSRYGPTTFGSSNHSSSPTRTNGSNDEKMFMLLNQENNGSKSNSGSNQIIKLVI